MVAGLSVTLMANGALGSDLFPGSHLQGFEPVLSPAAHLEGAVAGMAMLGSLASPEPEPVTVGGRWLAGLGGAPTWVWRTGVVSDLAIDGEGFFLIRGYDPTSREYQLTRVGDFRVDTEGRFVTADGGWLMGFAAGGETLEPVVVRGPSLTHASVGWKWTVSPKGEVIRWGLDDSQEVVSQVALAVPEPTSRVQRISERVFRIVGMDGNDLPPMHRPGEGGAGWLRSGEMEAAAPGLAVGSFDRRRPGGSHMIPLPMPFALSVTLEGPGCLVVRDPAKDERFWTRCGLLKLDADGWLVTEKRGYRVQGFSDHPFPGVRDLRVPLRWDPEAAGGEPGIWLDSVFLDGHGYLSAMNVEGEEVRLGRLKIDRVAEPGEWISESDPFWKAAPGLATTSLAGLQGSGSEQSTEVRFGSADPRYLDEETLRRLNHRLRFQQQPIERVASPTSLAISGHGCFLVRDPASDQVLMTRSGRFHWSDDAYLENDRGWRVQGLWGAGLDQLGDVWAPFPEGLAGDFPESRTIGMDGRVWVARRDGSQVAMGWIVLSAEVDPSDWEEVVAVHYRLPEVAGTSRFPRWDRAGERGRGKIYSGGLEMLGRGQDYLPSRMPTQAKQVVLWGLWGRAGRIQLSSDMKGWRDWLEFRGTEGSLQIQLASGVPGEAPVVVGNQVLDASAVEGGSQFYRIVVDEEHFEGEAASR
jgi:flagellar basal body rod protein FlgG